MTCKYENSKLLFRISIASAAVVSCIFMASAVAQTLPKQGGYPDRPITIIVPFGAGGGADQVSRALAPAMEKVTGVPFQVENKPGGGGLAAIPDYMARPKDGYVIMEHDDALPAGTAAGQVNVEMGKDLVPICIVQVVFSQIYIRPDDKRFNDWKSFVSYAKAHAGKVTMAHSDVETGLEAVQLAAIEQTAGFTTKQIRYDKGSERFAALMGGHVDALFEQPGDVRQFIDANRMKPVLTILHNRPNAFSQVPALNDVGLGDVTSLKRARMFWVHKAAPEERREYLEKACKRAFNTKEFQEFNRRKFMHLTRSYYGSEEALQMMEEMTTTYRNFYKKVGLVKE